MDGDLLFRGFVLGLAVAAAVGPMAILCIRRTLVYGRVAGMSTGAGIAGADGVYAFIAAFSIAAIAELLLEHQFVIRLAGGLFLLYLGVQIVRTPPADFATHATQSRDIAGWCVSAFALTLANPMTIVSFSAMFAGLGLASASGYLSGLILVAGVVSGSMLWWICLTSVVRLTGRRLTRGAIGWINLASGSVIAGFGLIAIASVVH